jgi:hypothetical protein
MKTFNFASVPKVLTALALVASANSAMATQTWDLSMLCGGADGQAISTPATGTKDCGTLNLTGLSTATGSIGATTSGTNFTAAAIYDWGSAGLGVVGSNENPGSTGPHATDNLYGTDAMLIKFDTATNLTALKIGWNGTDSGAGTLYPDSDLTVLAWNGTGAPPTMTGVGPTGLVAAGWVIVGNYANVGNMVNNTTAISTTVTSSYWLVSAYDSAFGGTGLSAKDDAFKIIAVAGNTGNQTPEPGSLVLLGAGLLGMAAVRRRRQSAV